jgi:glucose-1-phosphate thymidylyltransferase
VKVLLLAAGYATRLRPLTETIAKPLLPVGGRPMVDWILDRVVSSAEIDAVHLVTNSVYAAAFERWAADRGVVVHDDGTSSNEDRLGAVGDLQLVVERAGLEGEELLVLAGDNMFEFSLTAFRDWWRSKPGIASAVALYDCRDLELATHYGIVDTGENDRVVHFVEKPSEPSSTLAATVVYLLAPQHVRLLVTYFGLGLSGDNIGSFLGWLADRRAVYGYRFEGSWHDIGNRGQLLEADNLFRVRAGLPPRDEYTLE